MNPKEILRADLLDIIFDNRNKTYGAYALRKYYGSRLLKSLSFGLASALGICLFVHFTHSSTDTCVVDDLVPKDEVRIVEIPADKPVIPEARVQPQQRQQQFASRALTSTIQIVDNNTSTTMPSITELNQSLIDNVDRDGIVPTQNSNPVQPAIPVTTEPEKKPEPELLQRQPEFPGGKAAWMKFLQRYLNVPDELAVGERKTVKVKFMVSEDGTVTQFAVIQSGGEAFDNEVIRVLKKMPKWSPAVQNGRNVATTFTQPVTFQSIEE